jgi:aspartyl-tRNA(Asn)/glutamyl-tRNA(Gln) amidotransferase subunit A
VPVAVKDNICTEGVRTTAGSRMLAGFVPPYSATVITRLERAGAVVVGKTNCDEFAMGSSNEHSAFGPVANPWDASRTPGGSSGGSAAAVASRMVPLAMGSDTGGSVRQPAGFCGCVGLRPTYGRVSRYGLIAFASSLDQIGPLTLTIRDAAVALQAIAGPDGLDSTADAEPVPDWTAALTGDVRGCRVGVPRRLLDAGVDREVHAAFLGALEVIRSRGAILRDVELAHADLAVPVYYLIATAEASSNLARYDGVRYGYRASGVSDLRAMYERTRDEGFGAEVKRRIMLGTFVLSAGYYDAYYVKAQQVRTLIARGLDSALGEVDVIAIPTSPTVAFPLGERIHDPLTMYVADVFTVGASLAGLPAVSVPCGFSAAGLPIGMQLLGRRFDESGILRVADAYERETGHWQGVPSDAGHRGRT